MEPFRRQGSRVPAGATVTGPGPEYMVTYTDNAGRKWTKRARKRGRAYYLLTDHYYIQVKDETGRRKVISTGVSDLPSALAIQARMIRTSEEIKSGMTTRAAVVESNFDGERYAAVTARYIDELAARAGRLHVHNVRTRLARVGRECRFVVMADVTAAAINAWSARARTGGMGARNANAHVGAIKALMSHVRKTGQCARTLTGLCQYRESDDTRRPRRALTPDEFDRLVRAAPARAAVYRFAVMTGLRRAEIAALRVDQFTGGEYPAIHIEAAQAKARRRESLPLDRATADMIRAIIGTRTQGPIFGPLPRHRTVTRDMQRAGIPKKDAAGRSVDFHSLRKTYVTWLFMTGAAPRTVQALARHSDIRLTTAIYTDASMLGTRAAVEKLESFTVCNTVSQTAENGPSSDTTGPGGTNSRKRSKALKTKPGEDTPERI